MPYLRGSITLANVIARLTLVPAAAAFFAALVCTNAYGQKQVVTAANNAVKTFSFQSGVQLPTRGGPITVDGVFVNSPIAYDPVSKTWAWRVTSWTITPQYTANQQTSIQNAALAAFPGLVAVSPPAKGLDCHGYSLVSDKAGIYGGPVNASDVGTILTDQGYKQESPDDVPAKNDIVVYVKNGQITHTAVVDSISGSFYGPPINAIATVTSRWGDSGVYTGGLNQMPAGYGPATYVFSAANATKIVDPASPVDLSAFANLPTVTENPQVESSVDGFGGTSLNFVGQTGNNWSYTLAAPPEGIFLSPGQTLTLFGQGITSASVSGSAALYDWNISTGIDPGTGDTTANFTYEGSSTDLSTDLDGFNITSSNTTQGDLVFEENFNGTEGLSIGPVAAPEPSTIVLLAVGVLGLCGSARLRRKTRTVPTQIGLCQDAAPTIFSINRQQYCRAIATRRVA